MSPMPCSTSLARVAMNGRSCGGMRMNGAAEASPMTGRDRYLRMVRVTPGPPPSSRNGAWSAWSIASVSDRVAMVAPRRRVVARGKAASVSIASAPDRSVRMPGIASGVRASALRTGTGARTKAKPSRGVAPVASPYIVSRSTS